MIWVTTHFFVLRCETPGLEMTRERLEGQPDIAASAPVTPSGIQDYDRFFKIEDNRFVPRNS